MAASLNRVFLIGNLTRDPEVRHTPKGTPVGEMGLAINMSYRTQDGSDREEVCYVDIVLWGRQAETCQQYLRKGSPVFVEGRLQLDQWETQQGEKRSRLRVRAERVQFLSGGSGSAGGGGPRGGGSRSYQDSGDQQHGGGQQSRGAEPSSAPPFGGSDMDDDIPF